MKCASFLTILLALASCFARKEKSDEQVGIAKDCQEPEKIETPCNSKLYAVRINVLHYGDKLSVSYEEPKHHEEFYVNGKKGQFVGGVGNYYETYRSLQVEFEKDEIPPDTLQFSVKVKDIFNKVGVVYIKSLNLFQENFPHNYDIEKTEGATVNWYKYAERGSVSKAYFFPRINTYSSGGNYELCNPKEVVRISPQYTQEITDSEYTETDTTGFVTNVSMKWKKTLYGQITNSAFCGCITATTEGSQSLGIKIHNKGKTVNGKRVGKWKIYFDKDWNEATVAEGTQYYRIIDYDKGPPWQVSDYYLSGVKQFEGALARAPDRLIGPGRYYQVSGLVESEGEFDENGKMTGEWKYYHWNGKLRMKGPVKGGNPIGVWEFYDTTGLLTERLNGSELKMEK